MGLEYRIWYKVWHGQANQPAHIMQNMAAVAPSPCHHVPRPLVSNVLVTKHEHLGMPWLQVGIPVLGVVENMAGLAQPLAAFQIKDAGGADISARVADALAAAGLPAQVRPHNSP